MLMDRSRPLRMDFKLKNKVGGAIATGGSRNGGQETTIAAIHEFLLIQDAIVVGDGALWPTTVELVWEPLLRMRLDCKPHRIWVKEWLNWQ